jgi:hypothetical protein
MQMTILNVYFQRACAILRHNRIDSARWILSVLLIRSMPDPLYRHSLRLLA